MDTFINNIRLRAGLWGVVAVTALAAVAVLMICGRGPRSERGGAGASVATMPLSVADRGDPAAGERRFMQTCAVCHGPQGLGQPHMGADLRDSRFIREQTDDALVEFVKTGRPLGDPRSVLGLSMPPRGGNPTLEDGQIRDIVAFLRTVQARPLAQGAEANLN